MARSTSGPRAALAAAALGASLVAAQWNDVPPANDSATNPWWPQYPEGTGKSDFMLNDTSNGEDLAGRSRVAQWIVTASNVWREQFGSQPVQWNESCAREAQRHVETCRWEHWGSDNLAEQSYSLPEGRFDVNSMLELWSSEWDYYPFRYPEAQANSHFTAMTWNASNTLGCAWNTACSNDSAFPSQTFFVCNYWPVGNMNTDPPGRLYAENVKNFTKWTPEQVPTITPDQVPSSGNAPTVKQPGAEGGDGGEGGEGGGQQGGGGGASGSPAAANPSAAPNGNDSGAGKLAVSGALLAAAGLFAGLA